MCNKLDLAIDLVDGAQNKEFFKGILRKNPGVFVPISEFSKIDAIKDDVDVLWTYDRVYTEYFYIIFFDRFELQTTIAHINAEAHGIDIPKEIQG